MEKIGPSKSVFKEKRHIPLLLQLVKQVVVVLLETVLDFHRWLPAVGLWLTA